MRAVKFDNFDFASYDYYKSTAKDGPDGLE